MDEYYLKLGGNQFDIRVSVLPVLYGEKIVLRLLNKDTTNIDLSELGLLPQQLEIFLENIKKSTWNNTSKVVLLAREKQKHSMLL